MQCHEFSIMADLSDEGKPRVNFSVNTLRQLIHSIPIDRKNTFNKTKCNYS